MAIDRETWLNEKYSVPYQVRRAVGSFIMNRIPRRLSWKTFISVLLKTSLASSPPLLAWFYEKITLAQAGYGVAILVPLSFAVNWFDLFLARSSFQDDTDLAMVRVGDLCSATKISTLSNQNKSDAIRACLGLIEAIARNVTRTEAGHIAVSLVRYIGSSHERMKIVERNPGNDRPVNREVRSDALLGHHACMAGNVPRVVDNMGHLASEISKSPTQSKANYKSILIVPLGSAGMCKGFISIDCKRLYAFAGGAGGFNSRDKRSNSECNRKADVGGQYGAGAQKQQ